MEPAAGLLRFTLRLADWMDRVTEAGLILRPLNSGSLVWARREEEIGEREVEAAIGENAVAMSAEGSERDGSTEEGESGEETELGGKEDLREEDKENGWLVSLGSPADGVDEVL